jgi:hypothetical protein
MDSVMPFVYYWLYVGPAPGRISQPEMTVVATDGGEYPIDYRIWQVPHSPLLQCADGPVKLQIPPDTLS